MLNTVARFTIRRCYAYRNTLLQSYNPYKAVYTNRQTATWRTFSSLLASPSRSAEEDEDDANHVDKFNLHPSITRNLERAGIQSLFPVQTQTIIPAREGLDLLVRSRTGSGKTLAYGLPLLERIHEALENEKNYKGDPNTRRARKPLGIILTPTRELALQVEKELRRFGGNLRGVCVYGGSSYTKQKRALQEGAEYVVGTPGRVCDAIKNFWLDLSGIKVVVLDEADEMLKVGFEEQLTMIFENLPNLNERQTLLFSATLDKKVNTIAHSYMNEPQYIDLVGDNNYRIPDEIEMIRSIAPRFDKFEAVGSLIRYYCSGKDGKQTIVFVSERREVEQLASARTIEETRVPCVQLHGNMTQAAREQALNAFRQGKATCLVATDVASRGLDIPLVDVVIHYSLPQSTRAFVHRTGRTGRAGRNGTNILLHERRDIDFVQNLEKELSIKFVQKPLPGVNDLVRKEEQDIINMLGNTSQAQITNIKTLAEKIKDLHTQGLLLVDPLHAALAQLLTSSNGASFSCLNGDVGLVTLQVTDESMNTLRWPRNPRKVEMRDLFALKDSLTMVMKKEFGNIEIPRLEIGSDCRSVLIDCEEKLAMRLISSASDFKSESGLSFSRVENTVPDVLPISKPSVPKAKFGGERNNRWFVDEFEGRHSRKKSHRYSSYQDRGNKHKRTSNKRRSDSSSYFAGR